MSAPTTDGDRVRQTVLILVILMAYGVGYVVGSSEEPDSSKVHVELQQQIDQIREVMQDE